jgi:hypothetical protein
MHWSHVRIGLALCAALGWADPGGAQVPAADALAELTRKAELVFRGTVIKPGAANLDVVEPGARTAVVRIDETLATAGTLDDFTGREITVFLRDPGSVAAGEQSVFFTTVRLLGETLGVAEVGRRSPDPGLRAEVAALRNQLHAAEVKARVAAAEVALSGRVLRVLAPPKAGPASGGLLTEHDPQWREAVVDVGAVLRGRLTEKTVSVWFPTSLDVMWAHAPKLQAGAAGTWLLHRSEVAGRGAVWAVLEKNDQLSADEARIAAQGVAP